MRKIKCLFFIFGLLLNGLLIFRLSVLCTDTALAGAARQQHSIRMTVGQIRGSIFDCNGIPLTNTRTECKALAVGTAEAVQAIRSVYPESCGDYFDRMRSGKPILLSDAAGLSHTNGIFPFYVPIRYGAHTLASPCIGYTDGTVNGVCGIEKAYDAFLQSVGTTVTAAYQADALGHLLSEEAVSLSSGTQWVNSGVVLTIDAQIQALAEQAATSLSSGAILVQEVQSGKLRAMVSVPFAEPTEIAAALQDENAPLLNRTLSAYNVGSVFKLVVACAAEEAGVTIEPINCTGTLAVGEHIFQCIGGLPHGETDLDQALAKSCNCYFIRLAQAVGAERILHMAEKMGFGTSVPLEDGIVASAGFLPNESDLCSEAALANFSFGQGQLLTTPLQMASVVQTIANGGVQIAPTLVEGLQISGAFAADRSPRSRRILSAQTAETVRHAMIEAVLSGTVQNGAPESGGAGAKTATAESGWRQNGEAMIQAWCVGFVPAEEPQYVIVVLAENGRSGSGVCAPIFKQIADGLATP